MRSLLTPALLATSALGHATPSASTWFSGTGFSSVSLQKRQFQGDGTFYDTSVAIGKCGTQNNNEEHVVALASSLASCMI